MANIISEAKLNKVKELVSKLLEITVENGATENEAIEATLKVQQILAKYDMELSEIENNEEEDMVQMECETSNDVWRIGLASVIANNFCVKVFSRGNGRKKNIVFYGYRRHCEIAKDVFYHLYNYGRRRAKEVFKQYREDGYDVTNIKNQYYIGFVAGVKNALDKQCTALMIVTPPKVVESFNEFAKRCFTKKPVATTIYYKKNEDIYNKGYNDGNDVTKRRSING